MATKSRPQLRDAVELTVPALEAELFPSLGGFVCRFIEQHLVHGPGDVRGHPAELRPELRSFVWRAYEVFPPGHPHEGRRRFKRAVLSRRKGTAKTELLAWLAITELDPEGPVRFREWLKVNDRKGRSDDLTRLALEAGYQHGEVIPLGRAVRDPYIPLVATTEEQSDDLAFAAARDILELCELGMSYDVGLERITHRVEPGTLKSLAAAPTAREGARTSFQGFDETHLFVAPRLKNAHATMLRNIPKRKGADGWSLETTTMYDPGELSIAQSAHEYALDVAEGRVKDHALLFDHRQAALVHDLSRRRELIRAIEEASGDALSFADVPAIANEYLDPTKDRQAFRRYWLNQRVKGASRWIAPEVVDGLIAPRRRARAGAPIVLAFDGSYSRDSTALVSATIAERPHVEVVQAWERPLSDPGWRAPRNEVLEKVHETLELFDVREFAPDPFGWHREIEDLELELGETVVVFPTNRPALMGPAATTFLEDAKDGLFTIDGTDVLRRHLGNCVTVTRSGFALPTKSSADSPDKIDAAIGAIVAYARAKYHAAHPPATRLPWTAV